MTFTLLRKLQTTAWTNRRNKGQRLISALCFGLTRLFEKMNLWRLKPKQFEGMIRNVLMKNETFVMILVVINNITNVQTWEV